MFGILHPFNTIMLFPLQDSSFNEIFRCFDVANHINEICMCRIQEPLTSLAVVTFCPTIGIRRSFLILWSHNANNIAALNFGAGIA